MIPFFILDGPARPLVPEALLARKMGRPPFEVSVVSGKVPVGKFLAGLSADRVGLVFDPEFWYSASSWRNWVDAVTSAAGQVIDVPSGNQDPGWALAAPVYLSVRGLEDAQSWRGPETWVAGQSRRPEGFAVAIVPQQILAQAPADLSLGMLPGLWAGQEQRVRIFCKGWLHHFNALGDADSRPDLLAMCDWKGRVLELGCGRGAMARRCRQQGFDGLWVGVDQNRDALTAAGLNLDLAVCADLDRGIPLSASQFDRVVCADVLEHLVNPGKTLARLCAMTVAGGLLVASFPNVGHWSVVDDLLAGRWDEAPSGILCVTHLRFGTRVTWQRMLESCGWQVLEWQREISPMPPSWPESSLPGTWDRQSLETIRYRVVATPFALNPT